MSIVQVRGAGGTVGLDRTAFYGARVPQNIHRMIKPLAKLDKGTFRKILKGKHLCFPSIYFQNFIQDLQELQIPAEFHEDLASCVFGSTRASIDEQLENDRPRLPSLDHLDWRVDVTISTGVLNRVLARGVTMDMTLSDGSIRNFEMSVAKFQDLRFHVASVLNEMERLEKRSILKIKD
ncbi:COMM domain-containing protein 5 [Aplysia californica]|uniref:COMM domain-containing protein 5 n=1 Tax=Aplysia californica TaxID=6500 RepID=A0ABM1VY84_APLCA|nr:COMM domain-containing protein 5 [Aplysia californica]